MHGTMSLKFVAFSELLFLNSIITSILGDFFSETRFESVRPIACMLYNLQFIPSQN